MTERTNRWLTATLQPLPPHLDTDAKLADVGWATGIDALIEIYDAYCEHHGDVDTEVGRAQLQSVLRALNDVAWRGSPTETWIKQHRDAYNVDGKPAGANAYDSAFAALDELLDNYRDHADVGQPLTDDEKPQP